jgi:Peptidase family M28
LVVPGIVNTMTGRRVGTHEITGNNAASELAVGFSQRVRANRLAADVARIARPRNRLSDPAAAAAVERWLLEALRAEGWESERRPFRFENVAGYNHGPTLPGESRDVSYPELRGANVLARKRGRAVGPAILVGAHFDSLAGTPGADDNGSGVAALVELARVLAPIELERDVLLVGFDMEEIGAFGARALVDELRAERQIGLTIVFESIGYFDSAPRTQSLPPGVGALYPRQVRRIARRGFRGDWTLVLYRRRSAAAAAALAHALVRIDGPHAALTIRDPLDRPLIGRLIPRMAPWARDFARSDHVPFWCAGIPAIQVTDTANFRNPHYHRPTDTPDTLDYERMAAIVAATAAVVAAAAGPPGIPIERSDDGRQSRFDDVPGRRERRGAVFNLAR